MILKRYSGGLHAKNSIQCLVYSIFVFCFIPSLNFGYSLKTKILISIISFIVFCRYSPADTHKKPIHPNRRTILKIKSLVVIDIVCILCFFLENYIGDLVINSLITQTILISPISYRILNLPYDNWKEVK